MRRKNPRAIFLRRPMGPSSSVCAAQLMAAVSIRVSAFLLSAIVNPKIGTILSEIITRYVTATGPDVKASTVAIGARSLQRGCGSFTAWAGDCANVVAVMPPLVALPRSDGHY